MGSADRDQPAVLVFNFEGISLPRSMIRKNAVAESESRSFANVTPCKCYRGAWLSSARVVISVNIASRFALPYGLAPDPMGGPPEGG